MRHSTSTPTLAEARRFRKLKEFGCVCCWDLKERREFGWSDEAGDNQFPSDDWRDGQIPEIHHIVQSGRRIGHEATLPLCEYHHQRKSYGGLPLSWLRRMLGPSLLDANDFTRVFGGEFELLAKINREIGESA